MRFAMIALADGGDAGEAGRPPAAEPAALDRYERELVRAGVLLAAEALEPAAAGTRVRFEGDVRILDRLPQGHEHDGCAVAAFWMLQTSGEEEALEWARRLPLTRGTVEVRRVTGDTAR